MTEKEETQAEEIKALQEQVGQLISLLEAHSEQLEELDGNLDACRTIADNCEERLQGVPTEELSELDVEALVALVSMSADLKEVVDKFPELEETVQILADSAE